jgi:hypothetical protein
MRAMTRMSRDFFGIVLALVLVPSCEQDGQVDGDNSTGDVVSCRDDPRALAYTPSLTKKGDNGSLRFVLDTAQPAPPARGTNMWFVRVLDTNGASLNDATIDDVQAFMPDHGHNAPAIPIVTPQPDGTLSITPLKLFMPGLWQITIQASTATANDLVTFSFCVEG